MTTPPKPDRTVNVFVPIAVAVIALVGVIITAVVNTSGDGTHTTTASPSPTMTPSPTRTPFEPSVRTVSWGSRNVRPPPRVELHFRGTAVLRPPRHEVLILARFNPTSEEYVPSPLAKTKADGSWEVIWPLPKPPEFVEYYAAVAMHDIIPCPLKPCAVLTLAPLDLDELRKSGPKARSVIAAAPVTIPPDL